MKIFVSWSGERSRQVAQHMSEWISCVIQAAKPWISTRDIDRGALWFSTITQELGDTSVGIICLTKENLDKPWILFEAGALAKGLTSSRVCTFLVDLETKDVRDPLAQFNHTSPSRDDMWGLVATLNNASSPPHLSDAVLQRTFDTYWPQFEEQFKKIMAGTKEVKLKAPEPNEVLFEILEGQRALAKRINSIEAAANHAGVMPPLAHQRPSSKPGSKWETAYNTKSIRDFLAATELYRAAKHEKDLGDDTPA